MKSSKYTLKQKITLAVAMITAFDTTFTGSALNLSIPDIGRMFGTSAGTLGWVVTGYVLTLAALSVPAGRLADLTNRKKVLTAGIIIFFVFSTLAAFSTSIRMLIVLRILQGVGASAIFCTNTAILLESFDLKEKGKIIGYSLAATYVGLSAGPVIGGIINNCLSWRAVFAFTALVTAVALVLVFLPAFRKGEAPSAGLDRSKIDIAGNVLFVMMIVLFVYGLSSFSVDSLTYLLAFAGLALGVVFVIYEKKKENPLVKIGLFQNSRSFSFSNIAALMNYAATFAISYMISIYLQVVMHYSSFTAGLILIIQPVLMAALSPVAGRLSDRKSPFLLASLGMGFCTAGLIIFSFVGTSPSLVLIVAALAVTGFGFALFSSPNTNAVMSCVGPADYSVASSILATMRSIGHNMSMVIITILTTVNLGNMTWDEVSPEILVKTMRTGFIIFSIICAVGILFSAGRRSSKE